MQCEQEVHEKAAATAKRTKAAEKSVKGLRAFDAEVREGIADFEGLAKAEAELDAARSHTRELRPIREQKASAENHFKKTQGLLAGAQAQKQELQKRHDEIAEQLKEQDALIADFEAHVRKARVQLLALSDKPTKDLRDAAVPSATTSDFVPGAVAGHEANVESAKLRAASQSCISGSFATDRPRLFRKSVATKQVTRLACTSEGHSGCGGPTAPSGMLFPVSCGAQLSKLLAGLLKVWLGACMWSVPACCFCTIRRLRPYL